MENATGFKMIFNRIKTDKVALVCLILLSIFVLLGVGAEIYTYFASDPAYKMENISQRLIAPNANYWFGTDYLGRDVFLRLIQGCSTALKVGVLATLISVLIGTSLGILAGYFGGWIDDIINWIYATFAAMPTMLFILSFALLVNKGFLFPSAEESLRYLQYHYGLDIGMLAVYLGIGLTGWVSLCKVTRAEAMKLRNASYIQAAELTGIATWRILFRHVFPNLSHLVIIYGTMRFGYAIMTEVIVSYLGLGVSLEPSWGTMISEGQQNLWQGMWWEMAAATLGIFLIVLPLNLLGDKLRDYLDPQGA